MMIGQLSGGSLGRIYSTRYSSNSNVNGTGKTHSVQEALKSGGCLNGKHIQLYPDCLVSMGLGDGIEVHMKYDASSTDTAPVIYAWGKNADGSEYQQKIHVNQINPENATALEMIALHAHQGKSVFDDEGNAITTAAAAFGAHEKIDYAQFIEDYMDMLLKAMQQSGLERLDTERYLFEHQHSTKSRT